MEPIAPASICRARHNAASASEPSGQNRAFEVHEVELYCSRSLESALWRSSSIQTDPERDVRSLRPIGDLFQYRSVLRQLATRSAGLLGLTRYRAALPFDAP